MCIRDRFGAAQAGQLLMVLRDVLKREIPVHDVCEQIRQNMPHAVRLQLMHYLIGLANADGSVDRSEFDMLRRIGHGMGTVSYTHLRAHETVLDLVCRLLLEKKKQPPTNHTLYIVTAT